MDWISSLLLATVRLAIPLLLISLALIATVLVAVFHAEIIAHRIGEPLGTLVLALAVTVIEVSLIVSMMLSGGDEAPGSLRRLEVAFRGMAVPEEEVAVTGKIESVEDGLATLSLTARQGRARVVRGGRAVVRVPDRG